MAHWNQFYTHRKEKEMLKKAIDDDKAKKKQKALYPNIQSGYVQRRKEKLQTDRFLWGVGFAIMAIIIGLFIWAGFEII